MITQTQAQDVLGATAYDNDGDKIGKVGQLYFDDQTGQPAWVTVNTGLFGTSESFIPVSEATFNGDRLTVPYDKARIKDAPKVDLDGNHLDVAEEQRLYEYYDLGASYTGTAGYAETGTAGYAETGTGTETNLHGTEGHDTSGPTTDGAMTRSEEHLTVGTQTQESGRARLRKYVTTETETTSVPVRSEHAVITTEPITGGNIDAATDGPAISEEEHEVVLHAEHAVTDTVVEPVERVALHTETEVHDEQVSGEVRKENIEVEGDTDGGTVGGVTGGDVGTTDERAGRI